MSLLVKKSNSVDHFGLPWDLMFTDPWGTWQTFSRSEFDIEESADGYTITADMPGVLEDDLDISVKSNVLTIKAERKDRQRSYSKSYTIPAGADNSAIEARLEHGVLTVIVPKQPEAKPRKILVKRRE